MEMKNLKRHLATLAGMPETASPMISCYVNLEEAGTDPCVHFENRASLLGLALNDVVRSEFEAALERVRAYLRAGLPEGTRGAAVFARDGEHPFFLGLAFHAPLPDYFSVGGLPVVYPLVELKDVYNRFVVAVLTEESAHIFEVSMGAVTEALMAERPEIRRRVGREWTRARYQNHKRDRDSRFVKEKIRIIDQLMGKRGHNYLILAGAPRLTQRLSKALPTRLQRKLLNVVVANPRDSVSTVLREALAVFVEEEHWESIDTVGRLEEEVLRDGLGAVGIESVRRALRDGQADTLVIAKEFPHNQVREELVRQAIRTDTKVETVFGHAGLNAWGGVGCLLRYRTDDNSERSATDRAQEMRLTA